MVEVDPLAAPCGLYCGSCRYYLGKECRGCGTPDREGCRLFACCREEKWLRFCTECAAFPCERLRKSVGLDVRWLEDMAKIPLVPG